MNVVGRMSLENVERRLGVFRVARSDPQQQSTALQMLVEMLAVLVADIPRQSGSHESTGAAGDSRGRNGGEQRAALCHDR